MNSSNTKGFAPWIATLILMAFAIALGIVIMNFGRAQIESEAECPVDIGLQLSEIEGKKQVCYDTVQKALRFTIENGVNVNVDGLIVNIIDEKKAETHELEDAKMVRAGNYLGQLQYDTPTGKTIQQVKITPKIKLKDKEQICPEKALIIEKIEEC